MSRSKLLFADTFIGRAHGLQVAKKPHYTAFAKDPAKYLDLDEYLPPSDALSHDFKWVKPCSMSPEQLLAWAVHLYDRQQRKKKGENLEVLAFYPVRQGKGKAVIPAASSIEEYVQNLPHMIARHEEEHGSGETARKRPYVPGAEGERSIGKPVDLDSNILFESESPGSISGVWKDRIAFLKKLCPDAKYGMLVKWLNKVQVRT